MLNKKVLYGAAVLALGLTACTSDEPLDNGAQIADRDMTKFLKVAICTSGNNTRTNVNNPALPDDFDEGTPAENSITSAYLAFYDAAGKWIQTIPLDNPTFTDYTGDKPIEKVSEKVVPINLTKGQPMPAYVMCYLNPADPNSIMDGEGLKGQPTMSELRNVTRDRFVSTDGHFSMNNSVYYGENPLTGEQNVKMTGAPIELDKLYNSKKEANEATDAAIDIYVERYCAKVNYNIAEGGINPVTLKNGADPFTLTFVPEKWTVNADEENMYLVKKFASNINDAIVPSVETINTALGTGWKWNQPEFFRSYWACSPNYYSTNFPQTSDQVVDSWLLYKEAGTKGNQETGAGLPYKYAADSEGLIYYSYNQITSTTPDVAFGNKPLGKDIGTPHYTMEGTMGKSALTSANPLACAPSALMVGHYSIPGVDDGTTFYNIGGTTGSIYFEEAAHKGTISIEDYFIGKQNIVFEKVAANTPDAVAAGDGSWYKKVSDMNAATTPFEIKHPEKNVRIKAGAIERLVDESDVTLQLKKGAENEQIGTNPKYYIQTTFGVFTALKVIGIDRANQIIWDGVGAAKKFTNGKAYFSLPIMHLRAFAAGAPGIPADKDIRKVEWDKVKPGSFGLVRNHSYNIQIDAINGLGTGIRDLDYPIVVPMTSDQYWFKYRINVQQWRIVPTQNATFN